MLSLFAIATFSLLAADSAANGYDCDLTSLEAEIEDVVFPHSGEAYEQARMQFFTIMGGTTEQLANHRVRPAAILLCQNEDEVVAGVRFASRCGYKVTVRSGGHNYNANSSCPSGERCIQIDVRGLRRMDLVVGKDPERPNRGKLGPGNRIHELMEWITPQGMWLPLGVCASVALGGHFQSSSASYGVGAFGLGHDHVVSFRLAKADGSVQDVSPETDPELFKSVLGGPPGSWGVVTEYTVDFQRDEEWPHSGSWFHIVPYKREMMLDILDWYGDVLGHERGSDVSMSIVVQPITPAEMADFENKNGVNVGKASDEAWGSAMDMTYFIYIAGIYGGNDSNTPFEENESWILKPLNDIVAKHGMSNMMIPYGDIGAMPVTKSLNRLLWDFVVNGFRYDVHGTSAKATETILDDEWQVRYVDHLDAYVAAADKTIWASTQIFGTGLRDSQFRRNAHKSSYPHRQHEMYLDHWSYYLPGTSTREQSLEMMGNYRKTVMPKKMARTFLTSATNDPDADLANESTWSEYWGKEKWRQLLSVKERVDPCGVFRAHKLTMPLKGEIPVYCKTAEAMKPPTCANLRIPSPDARTMNVQ